MMSRKAKSEISLKLQQELEKRLEHLCFIHNQPALHVSEQFFELRNTIDIDTEELLARFNDKAVDELLAKANKTRAEFIKILHELEQRCPSQLSTTNNASSAEEYENLRKKTDELKSCSFVLFKKTFEDLALELFLETCKLEKRIFGGQTIIYVPSDDKSLLGNLIYIGEYRLMPHEIKCIQSHMELHEIFSELTPTSSHVEYIDIPCLVTRTQLIVGRLNDFFTSTPAASKFIYMGEDESKYAGYSAANSSIDKEFVSYRFPIENIELRFDKIVGMMPKLDLLGLLSREEARICVFRSHLASLDFLAPTNAYRLQTLILENVDLQSFDGKFISKCVNLESLILDLYDSSASFSNLDFLRPLKKLAAVSFTLRNVVDFDFSALKTLPNLRGLRLIGASKVSGKKTYPVFKAKSVLASLSGLPRLEVLFLCAFDIDWTDKDSFVTFNEPIFVYLFGNKFSRHEQGRLFDVTEKKIGSVHFHVDATYITTRLPIGKERIASIRI